MPNALRELFDLFIPNLCAACSNRLGKGEYAVCRQCTLMLKEAGNRREDEELPFRGRVAVEALYARYLYTKGSVIQKMVHRFKYKNDQPLARYLGECSGPWLLNELNGETFDAIVPLPLHPIKQRQRGYNQSEELALGLGTTLGVEVCGGNLVRKVNTHTQTALKQSARWLNVEGSFEVENPSAFEGKRLLLVDDVYTTGSTIEAAAKALLKVSHVKVTIFVLAIA